MPRILPRFQVPLSLSGRPPALPHRSRLGIEGVWLVLVSRFTMYLDPEALVWAVALLVMGISDPKSEWHFTLFWPEWVFGIRSPGYNLGHSISYLLRGDPLSSFEAHWLGPMVMLVLLHRIVTLTVRRSRFMRNKGG